MLRSKKLIWLPLVVILSGFMATSPALAQVTDALNHKIVVLAPQMWLYTESEFAPHLKADLENRWPQHEVELRILAPETASQPQALKEYLSNLGQDKSLKALVLAESPVGSVEAFRSLKAQRPKLVLVALDPYEGVEPMSQVATLTLALNHQARAFLYPVMAQRLGAKSLVFFGLPEHGKRPELKRQRRVMEAVCQDLGLSLELDFNGPAAADEAQAYLTKQMARYLELHGPQTTFVSSSSSYAEFLPALALRLGGNVLEPSQGSLMSGLSLALGLEAELSSNFGHWDTVLAQVDEKFIALKSPTQISVWAAPYPQTALLAVVEILISFFDQTADLSDFKALERLLEKYSPTARWQVTPVGTDLGESAISLAALLLQDSYWLGHGFQGLTRLKIPNRYYRLP